jgi:hypothetical protein
MAYLLLCVVMFWTLATQFYTRIFLRHLCFSNLWVFAFLSGFSSLFMPKRLVCANYSLSWAAVGHCTHSLVVRWLIVHSIP